MLSVFLVQVCVFGVHVCVWGGGDGIHGCKCVWLFGTGGHGTGNGVSLLVYGPTKVCVAVTKWDGWMWSTATWSWEGRGLTEA